ncbi:SDR family oxidoreductase [Amycolatopsis sacchari]|uniref:NAD(P)-dependent dehydrogenase, short-chain alcohol dehydrogenase family n=1 Tax=Amycolatopsis sacchari TaxID=115433 RepID=A0A1I3RDK5_9PSEU|nr:SDR family NAD(P)-dependent oxidoreductase [Amycolatopsis sacchari]SFJ43769.1 NAD(P)-dependent dehydrogenase, short-chain alcohol dehydrogenase family [Amycolatopsis sacchari]
MSITDFSGRVAFVTGGARGIGLGIVRALLRRGVRVAVADVDPGALERARELLGVPPEQLRCYQLDVADREQYAEVASTVHSELGTVSLLFNNAGIIDSVSPSRLSPRMWDHVMGINLNGVYHGIEAFLPGMIASPLRCHIVNTSSEAGLLEARSGFLYHASKFAVVGLSESFRRELAHFDIGVSVLFPGPVATDIVENTRGLRPDTAPTHSPRITRILDDAHRVLKEQGASPDAVGELVLDAVETNAPYIATRNEIGDFLRRRTDELVAAMEHAEKFLASHELPEGKAG